MLEANEGFFALWFIFQCSLEQAIEKGEKAGIGLVADPLEVEVPKITDLLKEMIKLPVGVSKLMGLSFGEKGGIA